MAEENSNPIWTTQTSQDENQVSDDFVLDFWDETDNTETETSEITMDNMEDKQVEDEEEKSENLAEMDFGDDSFDGEDSNKDDSQDDIIWETEGNNEENLENDFDLESEKENVDNDIEDDVKFEDVEDENENDWENNDDFKISLDDDDLNDDTVELSNKEANQEELSFESNDTIENESEENNSEEYNNEEIENDSIEPELGSDLFDSEDKEIKEDNIFNEEWEDNKLSENNDLYSSNSDSDNGDLNEDEWFTMDLNQWEDSTDMHSENGVDLSSFQTDKLDEDEEKPDMKDYADEWSLWYQENDSENSNINNSEENTDFLMDVEPSKENEVIKQPDMWDFEDNSPEDEQINDPDMIEKEEQFTEWISDTQIESDSLSLTPREDKEEVSANLNENPSEWIVDNQEKFYSENSNMDDAMDNPMTDPQTSINSNDEINNPAQEDEKLDTNGDNLGSQRIQPTLSLDQILDSELDNNPKFVDNSKAIPTNVVNSEWILSNKKMVKILAWVWLFLLVWFFVILAFPFWGSDRDEKDVVYSWDEVENPEEIDYEHSAAQEYDQPIEYDQPMEYETTEEEMEQTYAWWVIIEEEPEEEGDIYGIEENSESQSPEPYIWCVWDDCEEENEPEIQLLNIEDIEPIILDFKWQSEKYYSKWDDIQDKQLLKYAAQAIHLCESYQGQIENWEWLDEESFSSFKEKIKALLNKMERYLNWEDENPTYIEGNFDDENNFEWKDELRDYIYNRADWKIY